MDAEGTFSSAELSKLLKAPVLLSVDATKTTRTAAAMVMGCQAMDPAVPLAGVVLNRVAGARHESVLRQSIEGICGVPVLGAIPKLPDDIFPERHLGLVPPQETEAVDDPLARVLEVAGAHLDLDGILDAAGKAASLDVARNGFPRPGGDDEPAQPTGEDPPRIGVFVDAAFQFYYPENLEALSRAGAEMVEISPLVDSELPPVDALYLGGGFPETLAVGLSENVQFLSSVRKAAAEGLPVYAECGGAVYLGRRLHFDGKTFDLAGVLPVEFGFQARPRGHGYTVLEAVAQNPFYPEGETLRGHEFHYTFMRPEGSEEIEEGDFAFRLHRGYGFDGEHDGLTRGNVLACYTHIHALGVPGWAPALVGRAARFRATARDHSAQSKG
jgi:cobyrinic acid a,c-diamide synthase